MQTRGYRFLPHTTDAYIESTGASFEEALENAGLGLFDTMCDIASVSEKFNEDINVEGRDELELVYNWLESLLLRFELERKVYRRIKVTLTATAETLRINARAYGESFDRQRHHPKVEVKAVTYHRMEVCREDSVTTIRFIVDL